MPSLTSPCSKLPTNTLALDFLKTAQALITQALQQVQHKSPRAAQMVVDAARDGSFFRVTACLSAAGMQEISIALVLPTGVAVPLADVDFD